MRNFTSSGLMLFLLIPLFLLNSCKDECDKCNAAIQHFISKLPDNGCNPDVMQNAIDRISKDCDGHVNPLVLADIAADACCHSTIPALACENSGVTPWKTDFKFINSEDAFFEPVTIYFGLESNPLEHSFDMNGNAEIIMEDIEVANYSEMVFSVYRNGKELFQSNPITLRAHRGVFSCTVRKIDVREIGQGIFHIVFQNWQ